MTLFYTLIAIVPIIALTAICAYSLENTRICTDLLSPERTKSRVKLHDPAITYPYRT